ncbi:Ribosomal large subunit pseudouridine synthase D [Marinobacterium sp. xm-a-121]|jgi:23S rRNA pseudouridine1911/1915/1917 synthase|uniref:23S rRNA pseudouridine(1911/1915/1917) synthase RluD n=1 Tax=unclassified Marinobacterium TaxID=2644139 RepID=UPI001568A038|nr:MULTISPECIES: 23S rRNA pseudouridine(1911/1915/1917) synthase RluD [unclassified Marinobacterium]NRP10126.1 Ribosomal large subunit pseudouridine synthase D [Marinobacterium sp. xm-g-48]NRP27813.1 Ribosomal large subunit pseudouridine synthase D [Marinobacterium sp. xm-d-420]NRP38393.1 Ribosomal large subunit pseudouridine synthase D [Marinobacterium sp. xm-a-121]NRP47171.1 Ribosomal large subunit pseudouridine synthase D [Marinobacterium sp. xm-d-543]NRP53339.1 Ribosomal large subunit pseu
MSEHIHLEAVVPDELYGKRLDQAVAQIFPDYSRSRLQGWIKEGELTVDGKVLRTRDKLTGGEKIVVDAQIAVIEEHKGEDIPLDIVFEDEHILVLNKPSGLVVHPASGHAEGTLLNALLHHAPEVAQVPRAGIVHRLDRETTGLMVVAKTIQAQTDLVEQLQERSMGREYEAVVQGVMIGGGTVDEPMGRHSKNRLKMAVVGLGKEAITHYRVLKKFRSHTHIRLKLETGRTHQIRVHMAHIKYPLVGDPLYGGRFRLPKNCSERMVQTLKGFRRQALHAKKLELWHPFTGEHCSWEIDLPDDMQRLLTVLDKDATKYDYEL